MLSHTVTLWSVTELEFEFFCGIISTFKCSYFCFLYVLTFGGQHLNVRHLYQSYLCCLQWHSFSLKSAYHQTAETTRIQNGSHANSGPKRSIHTMTAKNLFDLSCNMSPKAGVWVASVFWGDKIKCSFQAFHPYLELWRDESNEFRSC